MERNASWQLEFEASGAAEVRKGIRRRVWPSDKVDAARAWLERYDVRQWEERYASEPEADEKKSALKSWKWYVGPVTAFVCLLLRWFLGG